MPSALLHIAQYVVDVASSVGPVTPMKLQKLLYYVKAWGLVEDVALVPGDFEKWTYGPVNPWVYHHFKTNGAQAIQPIGYDVTQVPGGYARDLIDLIALSYAPLSASELSARTHREDPWRLTDDGARIAPSLMRAYYDQQYPFRQNFPLDPTKPYVAVDSDARAAATLDMRPDTALRLRTYDTFESYRVHLSRLSHRVKPGTFDGFGLLR